MLQDIGFNRLAATLRTMETRLTYVRVQAGMEGK